MLSFTAQGEHPQWIQGDGMSHKLRLKLWWCTDVHPQWSGQHGVSIPAHLHLVSMSSRGPDFKGCLNKRYWAVASSWCCSVSKSSSWFSDSQIFSEENWFPRDAESSHREALCLPPAFCFFLKTTFFRKLRGHLIFFLGMCCARMGF